MIRKLTLGTIVTAVFVIGVVGVVNNGVNANDTEILKPHSLVCIQIY